MTRSIQFEKKLSFKQLIQLSLICVFALSAGCSSFKHTLYGWAMDLELGRADLTRKEVVVNQRNLVYLEGEQKAGQETVLLIHGFAANKENWVRFAGNFSDRYHVVALDLPGHGESFKDLSIRYDIDDQVKFVHDFAQSIGLKRFHIVGNSMGGAIAALYSATYPEQVRTATLIDPGGLSDRKSELSKQLSKGLNPLVVRKPGDMDRLMDFALEKRPFIPWPVTSVMEEKSIANATINDKIFKDIVVNHHDYDFKAALSNIKAPTLILWGKQDRAISVENAEIFEQLIPTSKKVLFDGVGHAPMIEIPEESAKIFVAFIQEASGKTIASPPKG